MKLTTISLRLAAPAHPNAYDPDAAGISVSYDGSEVVLKL
jgi:hypothetical protein